MENSIKKIDPDTYELTTNNTLMRLVRDGQTNWSLGTKVETIGQWRKAKTKPRTFESLIEVERVHQEWQGIAELVEPSHLYSGALH